MKLICIIIPIIIVLFFYFSNDKEYFSNDLYTETSDQNKQKLYNVIQDIDSIFKVNSLDYWIEGGTLLGAVRHRGLIPWDDDLDIQIKSSDIKLLLSETLVEQLNQKNYEIVEWWGGYKIYPKNGAKVKDYPWKFPFCDIFPMDYYPDREIYHYKSEKARKFWPDAYTSKSDLYPLKKYKFGKLLVKGPNLCSSILNRSYGPTWPVIAYQQYDHENEKSLQKKKFILMNVPELSNNLTPYVWLWESKGGYPKYDGKKIIISVNHQNIKNFDINEKLSKEQIKAEIIKKYGSKWITIKL